MAVVAVKRLSSLKIKFNCGTDENQKVIMKTKSYGNVKNTATNEDLLAISKGVGTLCEYEIFDTTRVDVTSLSE